MKKKILIGLLIMLMMNIIPVVHTTSVVFVESWSVWNFYPSQNQEFFGFSETNSKSFTCRFNVIADESYWADVHAVWPLRIDGHFSQSGKTDEYCVSGGNPRTFTIKSEDVSGFTFGQHNYYFVVELFAREWLYGEYNVSIGTKQTGICLFYTYDFTSVDVSVEILTPDDNEVFLYEQDLAYFSYSVDVHVNGGTEHRIRVLSYFMLDDSVLLDNYTWTIGNDVNTVCGRNWEISKYLSVGKHEMEIEVWVGVDKGESTFMYVVGSLYFDKCYFYREKEPITISVSITNPHNGESFSYSSGNEIFTGTSDTFALTPNTLYYYSFLWKIDDAPIKTESSSKTTTSDGALLLSVELDVIVDISSYSAGIHSIMLRVSVYLGDEQYEDSDTNSWSKDSAPSTPTPTEPTPTETSGIGLTSILFGIVAVLTLIIFLRKKKTK